VRELNPAPLPVCLHQLADMLQIGNVGLTLTEQYTHMTMWCIKGSVALSFQKNTY
jgi:hypothetical protein